MLLFLFAYLLGESRVLDPLLKLLQFLIVGVDDFLTRSGIRFEILQGALPRHAPLNDLLLVHHRHLHAIRRLSRLCQPCQQNLHEHPLRSNFVLS